MKKRLMFARTLISASTCLPLNSTSIKSTQAVTSVLLNSRTFKMGGSQSTNSTNNAQLSEFVKGEINSNCVVVFSKTTCGYCRMAKQVLDSTGFEYKAIEVNKMEEGPEIQSILQSITGVSTVPRVFVNGKCIGGGTETKALHQQGKLVPLIQACDISSNL